MGAQGPIRKEDVSFTTLKLGGSLWWACGEVGILPRSTETTELQAIFLNFPSAWFGEFPHTAPGYLKVKIFTWKHVTRSLGGVALHLTRVWGWRRGCCQFRALRQTSAYPENPDGRSASISLGVSFPQLPGYCCEEQRGQSPR